MFTNSSVGVVFWNKVFSSDTVSGYKCSHFLVTMHSLLLGIFIKKTKMESFCTKTSPVQGGGMGTRTTRIRRTNTDLFLIKLEIRNIISRLLPKCDKYPDIEEMIV